MSVGPPPDGDHGVRGHRSRRPWTARLAAGARERPLAVALAALLAAATLAAVALATGGARSARAAGTFVVPASGGAAPAGGSSAPAPAGGPGAGSPPPVAGSPAPPSVTTVPVPPLAPVPKLGIPAGPGAVTVTGASLFGWSMVDLDSGRTAGSANAATVRDSVESVVKPWIAADYLRRTAAGGEQPDANTLTELRLLVVDSSDRLAAKYWAAGGGDAVAGRLVATCGLTGTPADPGTWSAIRMTPADAVRYGRCLADGRAAGPSWTSWLLKTMTQVRGDIGAPPTDSARGGRWGIVDALPAGAAPGVSFANGWSSSSGTWHVSCLAITRYWVLDVMLRTRSLADGAAGCAAVTRQLLALAP